MSARCDELKGACTPSQGLANEEEEEEEEGVCWRWRENEQGI